MFPKYHILIGAIFAVTIWLIYPQICFLGLFLIFFSSFLIDFDHYLFYVLRKKDIHPKNSFFWFADLHNRKIIERIEKNNPTKRVKAPFAIFHTIEFILIIFIISLFYPLFLFILLGILFHSFADVFDEIIRGVLHFREFSILLYMVRKKRKNWIYY